MSRTCQAIVETGEFPESGEMWKMVCHQPRFASVSVQVGEVDAYVDLCEAHDLLVRLDAPPPDSLTPSDGRG